MLNIREKGFISISPKILIAVHAVIIIILAVIIFIIVSAANGRTKDALIRASLESLRVTADKSHRNEGDYHSVCVEKGGTQGNSVLSSAGEYAKIGYNVICNETPTSMAYAAWAKLIASKGKSWCVDSVGASKEIKTPATELTSCP